MTQRMISEDEYVDLAHRELVLLQDALDALATEALDVELESDILSLEFEDGAKFVINSHRAARQIWMAADRTAWHFDWDEAEQAWIAKKSGDELWSALGRAFEKRLGPGLTFERPPG